MSLYFFILTFIVAYTFKSAHNPKVRGSNPLPATKTDKGLEESPKPFILPISTIFLPKLSLEFPEFLIRKSYKLLK